MLTYPSIPLFTNDFIGKSGYSYDKYDGQNLRFEYSWKKKKWTKFGSRTTMFDASNNEFGKSIELFEETLAADVTNILYKKYRHMNIDHVTVFAEYYGEKSIAGIHHKDDIMKLKLFDVAINNQFISPKMFDRNFGDLEHSAELIYNGPITEKFIENVKTNSLPDINLFEGVVIKGGEDSIWRTKQKTNEYKELLKRIYAGEWEKFV